jgi:hypothetical protein
MHSSQLFIKIPEKTSPKLCFIALKIAFYLYQYALYCQKSWFYTHLKM